MRKHYPKAPAVTAAVAANTDPYSHGAAPEDHVPSKAGEGKLAAQQHDKSPEVFNQMLTIVIGQGSAHAEEEFTKDVWDMRKIPGARYSTHENRYRLTFVRIPVSFRPSVKDYIKFVLANRSVHYASEVIRYLVRGLAWFQEHHPDATDLRQLSRIDVERYVGQLMLLNGARGEPLSSMARYLAIANLEHYVRYLQRSGRPEAPEVEATRLFWPEDRGGYRVAHSGHPTIPKYIPDFVLQQVDQHLPTFYHPTYRPVVLLLRATGWRISDILNLRLDACLRQERGRWWLCGDILKTNVRGHSVPVTDEIARIVEVQRKWVKRFFPIASNPRGFLFPAVSEERQGHSLRGEAVRRVLRKFARDNNIRDEQGELYHFGTHAFRHTKAVELINNGMEVTVVQRWLAHSSPEMTLHYAKIKDEVMVKQWEKATATGVLRLGSDGNPVTVTASELGADRNIDWEHVRSNLDAVRVPDGYCFLPKRMRCEFQDSFCHKCRSFGTTPEFLPQFKRHREDALIQIDLGRAAGREHWVEKNQKVLEPIEKIISELEQNLVYHEAGKATRETPVSQDEKGGSTDDGETTTRRE